MPSTLLSTATGGIAPGPTNPTEPIEFAVATGISFVLELVVTGILGAIVIAVAPDFTDEGARYVRGEPVMAFVYGLGAYLAIVVATVLLAITIVGLVVVIPGLLALAIVAVATTTVGVVALGRWIGDAFDIGGRLGAALVVGVFAWALLGIVPVLGGLVTGALNAMGFGYLVARVLDGRDDGDRVASGIGVSPGSTGHSERREPRDDRTQFDDHTEFDGRDEPDRRDEPDDRFQNIAAADRDAAETTDDDAVEDETTDDDEPAWR